jgi:hypothetical protein
VGVSPHGRRHYARGDLVAGSAPFDATRLVGVLGTTAFVRMYLGAHLPLGLVGGAGLGLILSAMVPPEVSELTT